MMTKPALDYKLRDGLRFAGIKKITAR